MDIIFLNASGQTLFTRNDMESGHWVVQEMTVSADFPYDPGKVIERGMRLAFRDPATDVLEVFEIRNVATIEPEAYQQVSAEHIVISELQDEHINNQEITDKTAAQALTTALAGTSWQLGTNTASGTSSGDIGRGSVWNAITMIKNNWNVYIEPRVTISTAGQITGKYLDITPAQGTWRGIHLTIHKNLHDVTVTYNDEDVLTALYGYGGNIDVPQGGGAEDKSEELTFAGVTWSKTADHPAKPAGQTYLEWPEKTALYGRNGRPRFGYYQNADIEDPSLLLQKTWESLKRTAEPRINITGTCADLYRLGYKDEPLRLHDDAIVEIAETGETFKKQIFTLDVDLVDPTGNRPEIGDYIPNIVYINRTTNSMAGNGGMGSGGDTSASSGGGGGGGGRGQSNAQYHDDRHYTEYTRTANKISMVVGTYNGGYRIKAGEITLAINDADESIAYIASDHVNISATTDFHSLAGDIEHDADGRLVLKNAGGVYVRKTESGVISYYGVWDEGNLDGGVMCEKINGQTTTKIKGDVINVGEVVEIINNGSQTTAKISADKLELGGIQSQIDINAQNINTNAQNITTNAGNISVNAKNIKIIADDYVTINKLSTELQAIKSAYAEQFSGDVIQGNTVSGTTVNANSSLNVYNTHVRWCTVSNGTTSVQMLGTGDITFDRTAAYDEGYTAGFAACYNRVHRDGNIIYGPSQDGSSTEQWYKITAGVGGEWGAGGGFTAHGYAYVNGTQVNSATRTYT